MSEITGCRACFAAKKRIGSGQLSILTICLLINQEFPNTYYHKEIGPSEVHATSTATSVGHYFHCTMLYLGGQRGVFSEVVLGLSHVTSA